MDADMSSSGDESMVSLKCEEEFPWDMMYPWLTPVYKLVKSNGMWVWSVHAEPSVRVKSMLSAEEKPMIQVATIPCHEWTLVADCEHLHVILLIRDKPSFFIYPRDPRCDWNLVHRILNTYYVGVASLIQQHREDCEEEEEFGEEDHDEAKVEYVKHHHTRFIPTLDGQERARDQASNNVAGRGHCMAVPPFHADPFNRVPSVEFQQVYHVHHTPSSSFDFAGFGSLHDTHSPRLSLSCTGDGVPRGDA